jgi:dTDP-4-amino-4,6-dideoxygalactose transaminase
MFYIKVKDIAQRTRLIDYLKEHNVYTVFHYVPLHSSPAGLKFGRFNGNDKFTSKESERLIRLPMYYGLDSNDIGKICGVLSEYFKTAH